MKAVYAIAAFALAAAAKNLEFSAWANAHGRAYNSEEEFALRKKIYEQNVAKVAELNAKNDGVTYAVNRFADMSEEEWKRFYTRPLPKKELEAFRAANPVTHVSYTQSFKDTLPTTFSWVEEGAVTAVKDQGNCGSCWAFGSTGCMEGQWFLKNGELIDLSPQNLVDCDSDCMSIPGWGYSCDNGCDGGMEPIAFAHVIKKGGIMSLEDYPYTGTEGSCKFSASKAVATFSNWTIVDSSEDDLMAYLYENGPISVGVYADTWTYYSSGVYDSSCQTTNDHAVLLVGWGESNGTPYWLIKNSWGTSWGEDGYIRLRRGTNKCGVTELMSTIKA